MARGRAGDKEINLLVQRLARSGLLEYRLGPARGGQDSVVIEPQIADYSPQISKIGNTDTIALSRFAYLRRRGKEMVLESPRAGALFRITDPKMAAALVTLSTPQKISRYRKERGFPGLEFLGLLMDCQILFKLGAGDTDGLRPSEGDPSLVLWDFHDLLFHTHSTEGRQANPLGGLYSYSDLMAPLPAVRPPWPGKAIDLNSAASGLRPRLSQPFSMRGTRYATSTMSIRSRWPNWPRFCRPPRACARNGRLPPTWARKARKCPMLRGRIHRAARPTNWSFISRSTNAKGWRGDFTTTMRSGMH